MTQPRHTRAASLHAHGFVMLALACSACISAGPPTHVAGDPTLLLREGRASYRLLTADPEPGVITPGASREGDEYVPAHASADNVPPSYPPTALEAGCGRGLVVLRVRLDREGAVTRVQQSPLGSTPAGACTELFRRAAEETLRGWRFAPARRQYRIAGLDLDHDGVADLPRWESEPMEAEADIQFRFEVELRQVRPPVPR